MESELRDVNIKRTIVYVQFFSRSVLPLLKGASGSKASGLFRLLSNGFLLFKCAFEGGFHSLLFGYNAEHPLINLMGYNLPCWLSVLC